MGLPVQLHSPLQSQCQDQARLFFVPQQIMGGNLADVKQLNSISLDHSKNTVFVISTTHFCCSFADQFTYFTMLCTIVCTACSVLFHNWFGYSCLLSSSHSKYQPIKAYCKSQYSMHMLTRPMMQQQQQYYKTSKTSCPNQSAIFQFNVGKSLQTSLVSRTYIWFWEFVFFQVLGFYSI